VHELLISLGELLEDSNSTLSKVYKDNFIEALIHTLKKFKSVVVESDFTLNLYFNTFKEFFKR